MDAPTYTWEWGTAYDFFVSLYVLHKPNKFGLRGAWAKGVRSRLPNEPREFLEQAQPFFLDPVTWVHGLSPPRDGETMLGALGALPPAARIEVLSLNPHIPPQAVEVLHAIRVRGAWNPDDQAAIQAAYQGHRHSPDADEIAALLRWWAEAEAFGERALAAFRVYHEVFFVEEEARIRPALQIALTQAQALAETLPLADLLEELSQGVRFEDIPPKQEWVLTPSFWLAPLIIMLDLTPDSNLFVFGTRPSDASLVPGELVPDALFSPLKALADPTRLRILRYLAARPLTPTQLARRLRLRAPTVIHHLNALRLAGLVYLTFEAKGDKRYAARLNRVRQTWEQLQTFLGQNDPE